MSPVKQKQKKHKKHKDRRKRSRLNAKNADRHVLYERSVQCPEADVEFVDMVFEATYGTKPRRLREDFCGTAALCCEWVKTRDGNVATGVDLDTSVLEWGRKNNLGRLKDGAVDRVDLVNANVLDLSANGTNGNSGRVAGEAPEVVVSLNFSYFCFKERDTLKRYFASVRETMHEKGLYVLDIMGGPDSQIPQEEETEHESFSYVWDQDYFNPITHDCRCYIHFRFPDGSKMKKAFSYEWRLWSVAEVRDALLESGFSAVDVYWEGSDEDGEGDGVFEKSVEGDDSPAWVAYIVATP